MKQWLIDVWGSVFFDAESDTNLAHFRDDGFLLCDKIKKANIFRYSLFGVDDGT